MSEFFILGKTIDPDNDPEWVDKVCDIIDEAKSRDAFNDLSAIAYAILGHAVKTAPVIQQPYKAGKSL